MHNLLSSLKGGLPSQNLPILGAILSSKYPPDAHVTFVSLFWNSWPEILEIYGIRCNLSLINLAPLIFIEHMLNASIFPKTEEERTAQRICEQAKANLTKFFNDLNIRQVTPKDLDEFYKAGDFMKTKEIMKSFISIGVFKEHRGALKALELEVSAYSKFKERNKKLMHFAHTFQEFAEG